MKQCGIGVGTVVQSQVALPQNTPPAATTRGGTRTKGENEGGREREGMGNFKFATDDATPSITPEALRWAHTLQMGSSGLDREMFLRYTRATAK